MSVAAVEEESKAFVSIYGSDVDDSFPNEMIHFIEFIGKEKNKCSADAKYTILKANVIYTFPNVTTALHEFTFHGCAPTALENGHSLFLKTS